MPPPAHRPSSLSGHARSASASSSGAGAAQRTTAASSQAGGRKPSDRLGELKGTLKRSASSTSADKAEHRKSRPELELARRKVKLLSAFPRALSPTLPPSPPASRSPSPARIALRAPTTTNTATSAAVAAAAPSSASTSTTVSPAAASTGAAGSKTSIPSPPSEAESSSTKARSRKRRRSRSDAGDDSDDDDRRVVARRRQARKAQAGQDWSVDKFKALAHSFRERARKLKHTADARSRAASTSGQAQSSLVFLTELTDSILLWVYAFWADDQTTPGRVNVDMWRSLDGMKKVVRAGWETVVKAAEADTATKDGRRRLRRVRAVLGLVYLVDALVLLHTTTYAQSSLHNRTQRLQASLGAAAAAAASRPAGPTTMNGTGAAKPAAAGANGSSGSSVPAESPASLASSASSPASSSDPAAAAASSGANALPPDYLPTVMGLTASLTRALRLHGTSQALLAERDLERDFPKTWRRCNPRRRRSTSSSSASDSGSSESSDDESGTTALLTFSPLGPQLVDPDEPALGWAWPIGLSSVPALAGIPGVPALAGGSAGQAQGMGGMLPHLVVFGRSLLGEWAAGRAAADADLKGWSYNLASGWLTPAASGAP